MVELLVKTVRLWPKEDAAMDDDNNSSYWEEEGELMPGRLCLWRGSIEALTSRDLAGLGAIVKPVVGVPQVGVNRRVSALAYSEKKV